MRAPIAILALLWPSVAGAWECTVSEAYPYPPLAWPTRTVGYAVEAGIGVPLADIEAAFGTWSDVECSDLTFVLTGVVEAGAEGTVLTAVTAGWENNPDAVATTSVLYDLGTGAIRSGVITLNHDQYVLGDAEACDGTPMPHDTRAVLIHEIGHLVGLAHTGFYTGGPDDPTMAPKVDPCDTSKRSLEPDDVEALCAIYPPDARGVCHGSKVRAVALEADAEGCTAAGGPIAGWGVLALLLFGLNTCRKARSGG